MLNNEEKFPIESWDSFSDWSNDFFIRNPGYCPENLRKWFDMLMSSHKDISNTLDCQRWQMFFDIKNNDGKIDKVTLQPIINEILEVCPNYLMEYNYNDDVFLSSTIANGDHNQIKLTKHLRRYAEDYLSHAVPAEQKHEKLKIIDKAISSLGILWGQGKTSELSLESTISWGPRAFVLLGHYGPDKNSCFRQDSDKTKDKFVIGQSKNTFIITTAKFYQKKNKYKNIGRCWGFLNNGIFNVMNYYYDPSFKEGDIIQSLKAIFSNILKTEVSYKANLCIQSHQYIYPNNYGNWSFGPTEKINKIDTQQINPNPIYIKLVICPKCNGHYTDKNYWDTIDNVKVCELCVSKSNICQFSHIRTFESLVMAYINGEVILVHPSIREGHFKQCDYSKTWHNKLITLDNGKKVGQNILDEYFNYCDYCDALTPQDEVYEYDGYDACKVCVESEDISDIFEEE